MFVLLIKDGRTFDQSVSQSVGQKILESWCIAWGVKYWERAAVISCGLVSVSGPGVGHSPGLGFRRVWSGLCSWILASASFAFLSIRLCIHSSFAFKSMAAWQHDIVSGGWKEPQRTQMGWGWMDG